MSTPAHVLRPSADHCSPTAPRRTPAIRSLALLAAAALAVPVVMAAPAHAAGDGRVGGVGSLYHLADTTRSTSATQFVYGRSNDEVLIGDWNGDGADTLAVRRGVQIFQTNAQRGGPADAVVSYGELGDEMLVGDWNGDGVDTLAVRRGNVVHLTDNPRGLATSRQFTYGRAGDTMLVGDWNGDGADSFGVHRGTVYHLRNSLDAGVAEVSVSYGRSDDETFVGDWNGDGIDTLAARRANVFYFANSFAGGLADITTHFGRATDAGLTGDWDGNGRDEMGVRRTNGPVAYPLTALKAGACADRSTLDLRAGTVGVVDCATPHDFEVLQTVAISPRAVTTSALSAAGNTACEAAFPAHTGKQARIQHDISYTTVYPTPDQYRAGMREAVCAVWQVGREAGRYAVR